MLQEARPASTSLSVGLLCFPSSPVASIKPRLHQACAQDCCNRPPPPLPPLEFVEYKKCSLAAVKSDEIKSFLERSRAQEGKERVNRSYVSWNDDMDKALLDTFVEYYNKSDRCQNGWKSHVYTAAIKNVKEQCNVNITKDNIMARSKTFDKHCGIINGMLETSGFGWDWTKNKLSVDSDAVWDAYVEKHQDAAPYQHKIVMYFDSISKVYGKDHAIGDAAKTAAESSKEMGKEATNNKEPTSSATSASLKRQRSGDSFTSMMGEKLDKFTEALKEEGPKLPTSKVILDTLNEVEGLDEDTLLELFDILTSSTKKYESLLALPIELRKRWLMKQLNK